METDTTKKPTKPRYRKPAAVAMLEEMQRQHRIEQHPNVPPNYIKRVPMRDDTANGLTQCIVLFVNLTGGQAERINTTGRVVMRRGQQLRGGRLVDCLRPQYIPTNGRRGSADISATIGGRSVKIEVKIGRDRQSDAQREYQHEVEQAGGLYYIARDFTSFYDWYNTTFPASAHCKQQ